MSIPSSGVHRYFKRDGRMHPAWRATLFIVTYLLCLFVIQIPLVLAWIVLGALSGGDLESAIADFEANALSLRWLVPLSVVQAAAVGGATYLFRRLLDHRSFRSLGLATTPGWLAEIAFGLALGFGVMGGIFVLEWAAGWAAIGTTSASLGQIVRTLAGYAIVYVCVAWAEELIFRGYLLQTLREWPGTLGAVSITAVLFGLGHACNPNVTVPALLLLVVAGFVFAYAYLATGCLWVPIALHFSWNFFQGAVFGFPVSGMPAHGLFSVQSTGPAVLTGGAFGPEAGATGLAALGIVALCIRLWGRAAAGQGADRAHAAD